MALVHTEILPLYGVPEKELHYVVIGARQEGRWIFVRHSRRKSWELPAGHIEPGETADQAALRELYEETGTLDASLDGLCDYSVTAGGSTEYGRLYLALVRKRVALPGHEIAENRLSRSLPGDLTYPEVQTVLFRLLEQQLR
jgi:8-oxo-dGTP diphosphatase